MQVDWLSSCDAHGRQLTDVSLSPSFSFFRPLSFSKIKKNISLGENEKKTPKPHIFKKFCIGLDITVINLSEGSIPKNCLSHRTNTCVENRAYKVWTYWAVIFPQYSCILKSRYPSSWEGPYASLEGWMGMKAKAEGMGNEQDSKRIIENWGWSCVLSSSFSLVNKNGPTKANSELGHQAFSYFHSKWKWNSALMKSAWVLGYSVCPEIQGRSRKE